MILQPHEPLTIEIAAGPKFTIHTSDPETDLTVVCVLSESQARRLVETLQVMLGAPSA
jgi:hypothetical protein